MATRSIVAHSMSSRRPLARTAAAVTIQAPFQLRPNLRKLHCCEKPPFPTPYRLPPAGHQPRPRHARFLSTSSPCRNQQQPVDEPGFTSVLDNPPELVRTGRRHGWGLIILGMYIYLIPPFSFLLLFKLEEN